MTKYKDTTCKHCGVIVHNNTYGMWNSIRMPYSSYCTPDNLQAHSPTKLVPDTQPSPDSHWEWTTELEPDNEM